jgi:hypothetical protein
MYAHYAETSPLLFSSLRVAQNVVTSHMIDLTAPPRTERTLRSQIHQPREAYA